MDTKTRMQKLIDSLTEKFESDPDPYRLGLLNGATLMQAVVNDIVPVFKHDRVKYSIPAEIMELDK